MIEVRVHRDNDVIEVVRVGSMAEAEQLVERWSELDGYSAVIDDLAAADERVVDLEGDGDLPVDPDESYDHGDAPPY